MKYILLKVIFFGIVFSVNAKAEDIKNKVESPTRNIGTLILDAQFTGPFKDTIIQRWIDVSASAICYLYIPITVPSIPNQQAGNSVDPTRIYGPNAIGTISCIAAQIKQK